MDIEIHTRSSCEGGRDQSDASASRGPRDLLAPPRSQERGLGSSCPWAAEEHGLTDTLSPDPWPSDCEDIFLLFEVSWAVMLITAAWETQTTWTNLAFSVATCPAGRASSHARSGTASLLRPCFHTWKGRTEEGPRVTGTWQGRDSKAAAHDSPWLLRAAGRIKLEKGQEAVF